MYFTHFWKVALIVQYVDYSLRFLGNQVNGRLVVVELYHCPVNAFTCVFSLFQLEYMFVEIKLQRLVGVVDAQLFKAIHHKIL